jgi:peroxiredoxin
MTDLAVGGSAPDLELLDADERSVALSSLWQQAPLALIFLRHFG